jgi:hypothetical protein
MKYLRSQSLSDLDAEPPRVGVFELYSANKRIPKETGFLNQAEVTTKGQVLAERPPVSGHDEMARKQQTFVNGWK